MNNVTPWPKATGTPLTPPKQIKRPCDFGLELAWIKLETQLGTIEAYNRLVHLADGVKRNIDNGEIEPQNPLYATSIKGETS